MLPSLGKRLLKQVQHSAASVFARSWLRLLCLSVCLLAVQLPGIAVGQQPSVRSELSATTITRDESVTLTIVAIGIDGELDISALDQDFEVIGRSSSRQISTVTGSNNLPTTTSVVTWALELLPRDVGVFTVPAVTVGGIPSQLLSLTVNDIPSGALRDVFVEANVDTRTPWVQSQVLMTLRVFQAIEIVDGVLSEPAGADLEVQRIGEDTRTTEERDGRLYSVTERRFALFPQKSGSLEIDPITLTVSVPADPSRVRGFFSPTRKLMRRTDVIRLEVQARPPAGSAWWLPANGVTLDSDWAGSADQAVVDQPLTRSIVMRVGGVMDTQLPDISMPAIDGASLYAEEPVRAMGVNERGLVAEQTIKWAVIPQREGELVLPAITVEWFNTDTGRYETAALPEETLQVVPALNAVPPADLPRADNTMTSLSGSDAGDALTDGLTTEPLANTAAGASTSDSLLDSSSSGSDSAAGVAVDGEALAAGDSNALAVDPRASSTAISMEKLAALQQSSDRWRTIAFSLLFLWLFSGVGLLLARRRRRASNTPAAAAHRGAEQGSKRYGALRRQAEQAYLSIAPLAAVSTACRGTNPAAVKQTLLEWAARQWPADPPQTLTSLSAKLADGPARDQVRALDASFYSRAQSTADTAALMSTLSDLPEQMAAAIETDSANNAHGQLEAHTHGRGRQRVGKSGKGLPAL